MNVRPYALIPGDRVAHPDGDVRVVRRVEAVPPRLWHTDRRSTIEFEDGTVLKVPGAQSVRIVNV